MEHGPGRSGVPVSGTVPTEPVPSPEQRRGQRAARAPADTLPPGLPPQAAFLFAGEPTTQRKTA